MILLFSAICFLSQDYIWFHFSWLKLIHLFQQSIWFECIRFGVDCLSFPFKGTMFGAVGSLLDNFISEEDFFIIGATIHQDGWFLFARLMLSINLLHVGVNILVFKVVSFFSFLPSTLFELYRISFKELYIFRTKISANFQFMMSILWEVEHMKSLDLLKAHAF